MNVEMQKANMLADQINGFIKFVNKCSSKNSVYINHNQLYQVKLWIDEYKFHTLAKELHRINRFSWDEKYTHYLVGEFLKGMNIIEEYVKNHSEDLFLLTARLYTLRNYSLALIQKPIE